MRETLFTAGARYDELSARLDRVRARRDEFHEVMRSSQDELEQWQSIKSQLQELLAAPASSG